ncbi:hypothetical protein PV327_003532, partial [Microctonus hyperodae]
SIPPVDGSRRRSRALVSWSPIFSDPSSGDLDFVTRYRRHHSSCSSSRRLVAAVEIAAFLPNDKTFKEIVDLPVELIGHLLGNSVVAVQRRGKWEATCYMHWEDAADCERVSCRWFNYEDPVSEQLADILIGDSINRAVPLPIENMTMTDHFTETSRALRSQQLKPVALPLLSGNGGTGMRIRTLITRTLAAIAPVVTAVEAAASGRQGG